MHSHAYLRPLARSGIRSAMQGSLTFVALIPLLLTISTTGLASSGKTQPSKYCIAMMSGLKQPDLDRLCHAAEYIYEEEGKGRDWIHGLLTRLRKSGVPRETGLTALGTVLSKLLVKCETDPARARYVTDRVLQGAETLDEIADFLARLRRPEGWVSADLVAIFEPRLDRTEAKRVVAAEQYNSPLYKNFEWLCPIRLGLNIPPAFSARQFQIDKSLERSELLKQNKGLAFTLAGVLWVSKHEKLLAIDRQVPFLYSQTVLEKARPMSADIVSATILPDGSPLINVRECKSGYDLHHGIEQVRSTVGGILNKNPDAKFGSLEILVPSIDLINLHGRKYKIKAGNPSTEFSVEIRPIEETEFEIDAHGYLVPN